MDAINKKQRKKSMRSEVRSWTCYTVMAYVSLTVTVVGLSLKDLAKCVHVADPLELRVVFLGRGAGALLGTVLGGWLCDRLPLKVTMGFCVAISAACVAVAPSAAASYGLGALVAAFTVEGITGSALVCCTVTHACWAFPGSEAGPILQGCAGAFGLAGAALPLLLLPAGSDVTAMYCTVALCAAPSLVLLYMSQAPERPDVAVVSDEDSEVVACNCFEWLVASAAALMQLLLQGTNSAMVAYLVTYATEDLAMPHKTSTFLVTVLQGAATVGSLVTIVLQRQQETLLELACLQVFMTFLGAVFWQVFASTQWAVWAAAAWIGFFGGPTLSYASALFNEFTAPSGKQLALISLGSNVGASLGPFVVAQFMVGRGGIALIWCTASSTGIVFVGLVVVMLRTFCRRAPSDDTEPLLNE